MNLGNVPKDFKYRFNWNAPIISAPSDSNIIYHAGNVVFKTQNGGIDWEVISPDLTRNNDAQQVQGGIPFTNEAAGGENYNTLMSLVASPHDPKVLWTGSDDGLIHITQDGGSTWTNVTPKKMEEGIVNSIEVSPHDPAKAYAVLMRYKFMDLESYIYKTSNYGNSWQKITDGISSDPNFTRVVRSDKKIRDLLYAGTETGLYISKNDGETWENVTPKGMPELGVTGDSSDNDLIAAVAGIEATG